MSSKTYKQKEHKIDHSLIDPDALRILDTLCESGHVAYLVGGSVRDLAIKQSPKDFDISTSAKPEEIKRLFPRNCWLIGRRFRLAHIRYGHKIFEVSTFRAGQHQENLVIRDNRWGTPEEDAKRRDFTINGLFYNHTDKTIIDFVGGWGDIHEGILRTIGDPKKRFRQDPVRMIRLLKFRSRLQYNVDTLSQQALESCLHEITKSSPSRIVEEILRMLESGAAASFFELMAKSGLLELLFPCLSHFIEGEHGHEVFSYLKAADKLNKDKRRRILDRNVLMTCLLFPILEREVQVQFTNAGKMPNLGDITLLASSLIKGFVISSFPHFPKRLSCTVGSILAMQYRLTPLSKKRHPHQKLLHNKEFSHTLSFLKIRTLIDNSLEEDYNYWKQCAKTRKSK